VASWPLLYYFVRSCFFLSGHKKGDAETKSVKRQDHRDSSNVASCLTTASSSQQRGAQLTMTEAAPMQPPTAETQLRDFASSSERPLPELTSDSIRSVPRCKQSTSLTHQSESRDHRENIPHIQNSHTDADDVKPAAAAATSSHLMVMSVGFFVFSRNVCLRVHQFERYTCVSVYV